MRYSAWPCSCFSGSSCSCRSARDFARNCLFERAHALIEIGGWIRRRVTLCVLPLMQGEAETIQLRLEARQPLFEAGIVLMHRARLDDTQKMISCVRDDASETRRSTGDRFGAITSECVAAR